MTWLPILSDIVWFVALGFLLATNQAILKSNRNLIDTNKLLMEEQARLRDRIVTIEQRQGIGRFRI